MKRFLCIVTVIFLFVHSIMPVSSICKEQDDIFEYKRIAMLNISSSAEGSCINHFTLNPIVSYVDSSGFTKGVMFDAVIFSIGYVPKDAIEAETFIVELFKSGANFSALNSATDNIISGKYIGSDYKYPVFVSLPYFYGSFETDAERNEFCNYFIHTLCSVFDASDFENVSLEGITFDIEFDAVPDFRNDCINIIKSKYHLKTIVFSTIANNNNSDACFAANDNYDRRLSLAEKCDGPVINLVGVPTVNNNDPFTQLYSDYTKYKNSNTNHSPIVFSFSSFSDVHDCAIALEDVVPNVNARNTYELLREIVLYEGNNDIQESSDYTPENAPNDNKNYNLIIYRVLLVYGVFALFGVLVAVAAVVVKEINGKKKKL